MNEKISFCIKNGDGKVSLIRHLTIKPDGSCYISYDNEKDDYHFSLHPPNENHETGQMHLKENKRIVFKREIPKFYDFNEHRISESILILGSELRKREIKKHKNVKVLEIPNDHMAHIMLIRSNKDWDEIRGVFLVDEPIINSDETEPIIPYTVFHSFEDMSKSNYYLTYCIWPITECVLDFISDEKYRAINTRGAEIILGLRRACRTCVFLTRKNFLDMNTEIEVCVTNKDLEKYKKSIEI